MKPAVKDQEGQAVVEYIVLLAIVVGFYALLTAGLVKLKLERRFQFIFISPVAMSYKYGLTSATGFDEGTPKNHPRVYGGEGNFRLFLNPEPGRSQ